MLEMLIAEYHEWMSEQELPLMSADELLAEDGLTDYQKGWLNDFLARWDAEVDAEENY